MSASPAPRWNEKNAERHRQKHRSCFERILGISREIDIDEFKARSQLAITGSWAEFEAKKQALLEDI